MKCIYTCTQYELDFKYIYSFGITCNSFSVIGTSNLYAYRNVTKYAFLFIIFFFLIRLIRP